MGKFLIGLILVLLLVALVPLTAFGLIPGLSKLVGAGPRDLGISYTKEDSLAAISKMGIEIVPLPAGTSPADDFVLSGTKDTDLTFSSKELTAHTNNRPWKNFPLKKVQIKIDDKGTIESSGILVISKAMPYAVALGYSEEQINEAMKKYKIPPFEVPFYVKGTGSVSQNMVTVKANFVQIGAVPMPDQVVNRTSTEAESILEDLVLRNSQSFSAESLTFGNDTMHFVGRLPEKEFVVTN